MEQVRRPACAALKRRRPARPDDRCRPDGRRATPRRGRSAGSTRRSRSAARSLAGGQADGSVLPADDPDRRPADGPGLLERGVRAARRRVPVHATSTTAIRQVNDSIFGLQTGVFTNDLGRRVAGVRRARGRRRHRQRRPDLPDRPHALRRREGLRPRPRGPALGDRGHDRAADHGARLGRAEHSVEGRLEILSVRDARRGRRDPIDWPCAMEPPPARRGAGARRLLLSFDVDPGTIGRAAVGVHGAGARVDLSCGRLDVGPVLRWPVPSLAQAHRATASHDRRAAGCGWWRVSDGIEQDRPFGRPGEGSWQTCVRCGRTQMALEGRRTPRTPFAPSLTFDHIGKSSDPPRRSWLR